MKITRWILPVMIWCSAQAQVCSDYLARNEDGRPKGVGRIESLFGRQVRLIDLSDELEERRALTDASLKWVNLKSVFTRGVPLLGFGRPNVFTGLPGQAPGAQLDYEKVAAKSLRMGETKIERTRGRLQSGIWVVLPEADQEMNDRLFATAAAHAGRRGFTCVNLNCQIWADAGFTVGGESLREYYFPVPLLRDIIRYGLEFDGRPVRVDFVRTTPNYLEDVGLSINHAVMTTLCRHARRSCESGALQRFARHPFLIRLDTGARRLIGVGFLPGPRRGPIERPILESKPAPMRVAAEDERRYTLKVTEPSRLGRMFRWAWGPHSIFEIDLDPEMVDRHLPKRLTPFPNPNPNFVTRVKKKVLIAPFVTRFINRHLRAGTREFEGLTQNELFDMIRTDSEATPNKYNFVVTGTKLLITKNTIRYKWIDWYLSKHLVVSDYDGDVRAGGSTSKDEEPAVHVRRDSGSYQPDEEFDVGVPGLFREVFPGVKVVVDPL